jgi:hypothetical protein
MPVASDIVGGDKQRDDTMTKHPAILATAIVLFSGAALAQQQYDSLGSPTPAPNQNASPNANGPNVPTVPDKSSPASGKIQTDGSGSTTGSAIPTTPPANSGAKQPDDRGATAPTNNGVTPGGLTPD